MFLFQAEDGIRDYKVTGVQTCALPISDAGARRRLHRVCGAWWRCPGELQRLGRLRMESEGMTEERKGQSITELGRSEESSVGKEGRSRWTPYIYNKNRYSSFDRCIVDE